MAIQPNPNSTLIWHKSSASADGGNCVEVAEWKSSVLVRDSQNRSGAMLQVSPAQWRGFVSRIKTGSAIVG
jgi:hypothetical protein